jgi:hypothetical protein
VSQGGETSGSIPAKSFPVQPPPLFLPLSFSALPRTGGISYQTGAVLAIGVGQPSANTVRITDKGAGAYQVIWNSDPVHSFTGMQEVAVFSARGRNTNVAITLPDAPAAVPAVRSHLNPVKGGTAVQSGKDLIVRVNKPTGNTVRILDQGAGTIDVQWNGGAVHSFTGVTTILVQAKKAREDQITFYTPPLT